MSKFKYLISKIRYFPGNMRKLAEFPGKWHNIRVIRQASPFLEEITF